MCNKALDSNPHALEFAPDSYVTQETCDKAFNKSFIAFIYIPNWYKVQEMCERIFSDDPFLLRYVPHRYKKLLMISYQHYILFPFGLLQAKR